MKKTFVMIMVVCAIMCTGCGNTPVNEVQTTETRELKWYEQDIIDMKEEISNKYGEGHWKDPDSVEEVQTFIVVSPSNCTQTEYDYDLKTGFILTTRFTYVD